MLCPRPTLILRLVPQLVKCNHFWWPSGESHGEFNAVRGDLREDPLGSGDQASFHRQSQLLLYSSWNLQIVLFVNSFTYWHIMAIADHGNIRDKTDDLLKSVIEKFYRRNDVCGSENSSKQLKIEMRPRKRARRGRKNRHCSPLWNHLGWLPSSFWPDSLFKKSDADRPMDQRTDGRTNERTDQWTDRRTDKPSYRNAWT